MSVYSPQAEWIQSCRLQKLIEKLGCADKSQLHTRAIQDPEWFWNEVMLDLNIEFDQWPSSILKNALPFAQWAENGRLKLADLCIDRHARKNPQKIALYFEADEENKKRSWTYHQLAVYSSQMARLLQKHGAQPGDRVALLMPMRPEMIACFFGALRAGLSVIPIFSGYGQEAIESRIQDAQVKFVFASADITRRGKPVELKKQMQDLQKHCSSLEQIFWLHQNDFENKQFGSNTNVLEAYSWSSEEPCLYLYTSGTTGTPKACVHTPFGVLATTAKELAYHFDLQPHDTFFWYTDVGWMMGPWEIFGCLQQGASLVLFEGVPNWPDADRIWRILKDYQVTQFGISPTAVRVLKKEQTGFLNHHHFDHLRVLGSTGEPWDEETWLWFFEKVGKKRCPIINISGGTEIMGCLLAPSPLDPLKPSSLAGPALGVDAQAWTEEAEPLKQGLGHLVCRNPLPSMTKGFLNNEKRYLETYFEKFGEDTWYHGDWAFIDDEGYWFLKGRSDDTIKVAGKRVGPNEYESVLMEQGLVAEVAAVGIPHKVKGESVHCFVVLKSEPHDREALREEFKKQVVDKMGKAFAPEAIWFVESLPKTRSGKILRGVIRKLRLEQSVDPDAAENPESFVDIREAS